MKNEFYTECNSLAEIQTATESLDKAKLCPIKIDDGGVIKDIKRFQGVYNISQGELSAPVSEHYNLIQHKEYFDTFAQALDRLNIDYKMTIKSQGDKAFADVEFKNKNLKFDKLNEEFITGLRLMNSYNRTTGLGVAPRFTRLACSNGMIVTRSETVLTLRHNSALAKEIQKFVETRLNSIINKYDELNKWVSEGMADSIEWEAAARILEKLFSQVKHREEILKRLGISLIQVTDKKTKKKKVSYVLDDATKNKPTRWDIYNACTHYITHSEHITPHIEDYFHRKAEKFLTTPLNQMPTIKITI